MSGSRGLGQLRQELASSDDRAGDEVREEAQVDGRVDQAGRLDQPAPDVDHIGDRLEGVEADADRQRDRDQRQRHPEADAVQQFGRLLDEERVVLEDPQDGEVERHRADHEQPPAPLVLGPPDQHRGPLVAERDRRRAADRSASSPTRRRRSWPARMNGFQARGRDISAHERRQDDREEDRELDGGKEHVCGRSPGPGTEPPGARPDYVIAGRLASTLAARSPGAHMRSFPPSRTGGVDRCPSHASHRPARHRRRTGRSRRGAGGSRAREPLAPRPHRGRLQHQRQRTVARADLRDLPRSQRRRQLRLRRAPRQVLLTSAASNTAGVKGTCSASTASAAAKAAT